MHIGSMWMSRSQMQCHERLSKTAANRDGAAALVLEQRKTRKYPNLSLVPFAIEAHGRMGESAMRLAKMIAPKPCPGSVKREEAIAALYQKVAASLQKTQADAIITATRRRRG